MIDKLKLFKAKLGKWFWIILIVVALIVYRYYSSTQKEINVQTVKATTGNLVQSVSTSGTVKADQYSVLTFPSGGKISGVFVKSGQKVVKGAWIAKLDTVPLNAAYQQALNNYRNYQAIADQVLDSVKGHSGDENYTQRASRTTAEVNRDNAYNAVLAAQSNLANATIQAPFNGIMDTVSPSSPGIQVVAASANYTIVNPETTYFDAEVEETDLPNLKVGQKVDISLDAYPEEKFTGEVSVIGVVAFISSTGGNAYHIRITLPPNQNLKFRVGMQGDADIVYNIVPNVVKVSGSAIVSENAKTFVWVLENGRTKKRQVETGPVSVDETQIKSGLSDGEIVIDSPAATLKEGQKVKID